MTSVYDPLRHDDAGADGGVASAGAGAGAGASGAGAGNGGVLDTIADYLRLFFGRPGMSRFRTKLQVILTCELAFLAFALLASLTIAPWRASDSPDALTAPSADVFVLSYLAIAPRTALGLVGLLFFPFLHPTLFAALIDVFPFFLLGFIVLLRPHGLRTFTSIWLVYQFIGGAFVWLLGRANVLHTGCGGWIFAMFFYVLVFGAFRQDARSIILSIAVFILYSGMFWSLLPGNAGFTSYESHIAGIVVGCVLGAYEGGFTYAENDSLDALQERLRALLEPFFWRRTVSEFVRVETDSASESTTTTTTTVVHSSPNDVYGGVGSSTSTSSSTTTIVAPGGKSYQSA